MCRAHYLPSADAGAADIDAQNNDVNSRPIVRADCIKFVHTFRNQFTVEQLLVLMPVLIAHLRSEHVSGAQTVVVIQGVAGGIGWDVAWEG